MKPKHILLFFISICLGSFSMMSQETDVVNDTLPKHVEKYGIRVGADISKLARTAFEEGFTGFEVMGDFRFSEKFYAAAEIGNETRDWDDENLTATAKGSYVKLGVDYNAYKNWLGMDNAIYSGLRYGFSSFSQELTSYGIYTTNPSFPTQIVTTSQDFDGLSASWIEFIFGVKTEIVNNLYLSIHLQLKRSISETRPENFDNLIIPGFNRTYDSSQFGVGYGYGISYLIPIIKR